MADFPHAEPTKFSKEDIAKFKPLVEKKLEASRKYQQRFNEIKVHTFEAQNEENRLKQVSSDIAELRSMIKTMKEIIGTTTGNITVREPMIEDMTHRLNELVRMLPEEKRESVKNVFVTEGRRD